jgi:site-specific DNA-methyltransferase (adenine-specific)
VKPYYEHAGITIYHGDCQEILLSLPVAGLVLTDPPYGIGYRSNHNSSHKATEWARWVRDQNMPGIIGDDEPINPAPLLSAAPLAAIFGGSYLANQLPPTRCWIVWDKRDGIGPNNQADCEMAWTNFPKPSRIYRHLWSGLLRAGEENVARSAKLHPHQKPTALLGFVIDYSDSTGVVLDPYCGSGGTLRAAKDRNRPAIGIEIEERYCEIAARRAEQEVLGLGGVA